MFVLSIENKARVEHQQRELTQDRDPLFIGYSVAAIFHLNKIPIKSRQKWLDDLCHHDAGETKFEVC